MQGGGATADAGDTSKRSTKTTAAALHPFSSIASEQFAITICRNDRITFGGRSPLRWAAVPIIRIHHPLPFGGITVAPAGGPISSTWNSSPA